MIKTTTFDYDLSGIDRITQTPTVGELLTFQQQVNPIQTSYKCKITEVRNQGWSRLMCSKAQWTLKRNIPATVVPPVHPGPYTGN